MTISFPTSPESRSKTKLWRCCHCGRRNVYTSPEKACGKRRANLIVFGDGFDCGHKRCSECKWKWTRRAPPPEQVTTSTPPMRTTHTEQSHSAIRASPNRRRIWESDLCDFPVPDLTPLPSPISPVVSQSRNLSSASQIDRHGQNGSSSPLDRSEPSAYATWDLAPRSPPLPPPPASHTNTPDAMPATNNGIDRAAPFYGMFPLPPPRSPPAFYSGVSDLALEPSEEERQLRSNQPGSSKSAPASGSLSAPPARPNRPGTAPPTARPDIRALLRQRRHLADPPLRGALENPFSLLNDLQAEDEADEETQ